MDNVWKLGGKVRAAREAQGMTQLQLARNVGVDASWVSHIENGTRLPSVLNLRALCDALYVSADFLLGRRALQEGE